MVGKEGRQVEDLMIEEEEVGRNVNKDSLSLSSATSAKPG